MSQVVVFDVRHDIADCPAARKETLEPLIENLERFEDRLEQASGGTVKVKLDWYERNNHVFHYLCELDDTVRIAQAEDYLKTALGLPKVAVSSHPTESGVQALEVLKAKLAHL